MFDFVIVGAGFAGSVLAERLAACNKRILVIDKRRHIGGNCYDCFDAHGVLIHQYGPHLFHTDNKAVFDYLSQFTTWQDYQHRVLAFIDGQLVPAPFNLNAITQLFPSELAHSLTNKLIATYGYGQKIPILALREHQDAQLTFLADFIYTKLFVNYTAKQWGCTPESIAPEVTGRVPVHIARDDRYFQDRYQAVPAQGYTKLFENLLQSPNISLLLNTDFNSVMQLDTHTGKLSLLGQPFAGELIYTGMIDELFNYRFGELAYRSLQFAFEHHAVNQYQPTTTVNYPNDYDYTRITEFKHIHAQSVQGTTIVKEFPQAFVRHDPSKNIPYYPIFTEANAQQYQQYLHFAQSFSNITLVGRLAENRYYDMDDMVARALQVFNDKGWCNAV